MMRIITAQCTKVIFLAIGRADLLACDIPLVRGQDPSSTNPQYGIAINNQNQVLEGDIFSINTKTIQFRPKGKQNTVFLWINIRMICTDTTDFTLSNQKLVKTRSGPQELRLVTPQPAKLTLKTGAPGVGRLLCLRDKEVAFQAQGQPVGLVYPAKLVKTVELTNETYEYDPLTGSMKKKETRKISQPSTGSGNSAQPTQTIMSPKVIEFFQTFGGAICGGFLVIAVIWILLGRRKFRCPRCGHQDRRSNIKDGRCPNCESVEY